MSRQTELARSRRLLEAGRARAEDERPDGRRV